VVFDQFMSKALSITLSALRLWWDEFMLLTLFNLVWLALQMPIITGPPATAAMYAVARRLADDEFIEPRHGWEALRQMFWPALKWGAANAVIVVVTIGNFWAYRNAPGLLWMTLRLLWGAIALIWFVLNLFYWPFWLAQSDRRMRTTLRNCAVFLLKAPVFGLTLALVSILLIVVSVLITLPLAVSLMAWLALIGVLAVDEAVKQFKTNQPDPRAEMSRT
jgi:uncharacterized membrane protein YesL